MCTFKHISIRLIYTTKRVMYVIVWDIIVVSHHIHICIKPILSWHFIRSCWQTASLMYMNGTFQNNDPVVNSGEHNMSCHLYSRCHALNRSRTHKINKPNYKYTNPLITGSQWYFHRWVLHFLEVQWPETIFMSCFLSYRERLITFMCLSNIVFVIITSNWLFLHSYFEVSKKNHAINSAQIDLLVIFVGFLCRCIPLLVPMTGMGTCCHFRSQLFST